MRVLGIESSCDETGVALYCLERGLLAHRLHSQIALHAAYGGVVPELASRDHVRRLLPLVTEVLAEAKLRRSDIDGVAYTAGPGLVGALMVGAAAGRALAWALEVPAVGVHHLEAHLLAPLLEGGPLPTPFVALLVSGGHSMLIEVAELGQYRLLGDTLDDAAGEAFDKTAKLLGLPYPGGAALAELATQGHATHSFARPLTDRPGLDFSFSGLKTQVLLAVQRHQPLDEAARANVAKSFEEAVTETLAIKCRRAMQQTGAGLLVVAGGVGANRRLRERLAADATAGGWQLRYPRPAFCTDNGAMVALAGALRLAAGNRQDLAIDVRPRWDLSELPAMQFNQPPRFAAAA